MGLFRDEFKDLTAVLWSDAVFYVLWKKDPHGLSSLSSAFSKR